MKVRSLPSVERLRAISDLELKLVTSWLLSERMLRSELLGTSRLSRRKPEGVSWSRKMVDVMPKLASTSTLLKTSGYLPLLVAATQGTPLLLAVLAQFGARRAPTFTLLALLSYTLRLTMRLPG